MGFLCVLYWVLFFNICSSIFFFSSILNSGDVLRLNHFAFLYWVVFEFVDNNLLGSIFGYFFEFLLFYGFIIDNLLNVDYSELSVSDFVVVIGLNQIFISGPE